MFQKNVKDINNFLKQNLILDKFNSMQNFGWHNTQENSNYIMRFYSVQSDISFVGFFKLYLL
jgi:hypothetical protein